MTDVESMLEFAEFLVWTYEVEFGFVDCEDAAELIEGYWLMWVPPGPLEQAVPLQHYTLAERAISSSPALYATFLEWKH